MPRLMGVDIPGKKHIRFALRYLHGIGPKRADDVLAAVTVGGGLMGVFGMLLGVPIVSALYRILREDMDGTGNLQNNVS